VQAVAAAGGAIISISRRDYGVDGTLNRVVRAKRRRSPGDKFIPEGFSVEFQLKGTTVATFNEEFVAYDLNVRNYDLIVGRTPVETPLYLFLICFGPDTKDWIAVESEQLILTASAYWWKQTAAPTENVTTVRLQIPVVNKLTAGAIEDMLVASKNRFV
jgi:hypothetical protein